MKRIPLIRRKSLLSAGIPNSHLMNLAQRNEYFKKRVGDRSIFTPLDAFLIFVASELFEFLPFRNVSGIVNDLVKFYPNIYGLVRKNPKQFLIVELKPLNVVPGIELSKYIVFPILTESLRVLDWSNRKSMVLINLEKIYMRVEDLFIKEGLEVPTEDI